MEKKTKVRSLKVIVRSQVIEKYENTSIDYFWMRLPVDEKCISDVFDILEIKKTDEKDIFLAKMSYEVDSIYIYENMSGYSVSIEICDITDIGDIICKLQKIGLLFTELKKFYDKFSNVRLTLNANKKLNSIKYNEWGC